MSSSTTNSHLNNSGSSLTGGSGHGRRGLRGKTSTGGRGTSAAHAMPSSTVLKPTLGRAATSPPSMTEDTSGSSYCSNIGEASHNHNATITTYTPGMLVLPQARKQQGDAGISKAGLRTIPKQQSRAMPSTRESNRTKISSIDPNKFDNSFSSMDSTSNLPKAKTKGSHTNKRGLGQSRKRNNAPTRRRNNSPPHSAPHASMQHTPTTLATHPSNNSESSYSNNDDPITIEGMMNLPMPKAKRQQQQQQQHDKSNGKAGMRVLSQTPKTVQQLPGVTAMASPATSSKPSLGRTAMAAGPSHHRASSDIPQRPAAATALGPGLHRASSDTPQQRQHQLILLPQNTPRMVKNSGSTNPDTRMQALTGAGLRKNAAPSSQDKTGLRLANQSSSSSPNAVVDDDDDGIVLMEEGGGGGVQDVSSVSCYDENGLPCKSRVALRESLRPGAYAGDLEEHYNRNQSAAFDVLTGTSGGSEDLQQNNNNNSEALKSARLSEAKTAEFTRQANDNHNNRNVDPFASINARAMPEGPTIGSVYGGTMAGSSIKEQATPASKKRFYIICACILLVVIAVVVVVAVVVAGGSGDESTKSTTNIQQVPEATVHPISFYLNMLPNLTAVTLLALHDPESPQKRALTWLMEDSEFENLPTWRKHQRFALATLYYALGGPQWPTSNAQAKNWLSYDVPECQWFVHNNTCNAEGELKYMEISKLSGFAGTLPPELQLLEKLKGINFSSNLFNMLLEDFVPFGAEGLPSSLSVFNCTQCKLQGSIPSEFGLGLMPNLQDFVVADNELTGSLPTELALMTSLQTLHLMKNTISGTFPVEISQMSTLVDLKLNDCQLSGSIPSEIGNLSNLNWLDFDNNSLSGSLPTELAQLRKLSLLGLDANSITGRLPSEIFSMTALKVLGLDRNRMRGTLPPEIGQLSSLVRLYLNHNGLDGLIPSQLGNLRILQILHLGWNNFSGTVPPELSRLTTVVEMVLLGNDFSTPPPADLPGLLSS